MSFQFSVFCCFTSAQCCRPHMLAESGLATYCPCQLKTGNVSSKQIHMSIVYTLLFTSSLITVPSRMCGFFSSSTTRFPARTTFCIEMRGLTILALLIVVSRLLITSYRCSFSLSSSRHHVCRSSSFSADSSMFSLSSSWMAYNFLLPPFLHQAAMCPVLPPVQHVLGFSLATFLLPFASFLP